MDDGLDVSLDSCGITTSVVRMDFIVFVLELVLMRFVRAMVTFILASLPSYMEAMFLLEQGKGLTIQSRELSALGRPRTFLVILLWILELIISHNYRKNRAVLK